MQLSFMHVCKYLNQKSKKKEKKQTKKKQKKKNEETEFHSTIQN